MHDLGLFDTTGREMYLYYRAGDWLHGWIAMAQQRILSERGLGATQNIAPSAG
jgi:hypothetical protein